MSLPRQFEILSRSRISEGVVGRSFLGPRIAGLVVIAPDSFPTTRLLRIRLLASSSFAVSFSFRAFSCLVRVIYLHSSSFALRRVGRERREAFDSSLQFHVHIDNKMLKLCACYFITVSTISIVCEFLQRRLLF